MISIIDLPTTEYMDVLECTRAIPPITHKTLGQVLQEIYQDQLDEIGVASIDDLFIAYKALSLKMSQIV